MQDIILQLVVDSGPEQIGDGVKRRGLLYLKTKNKTQLKLTENLARAGTDLMGFFY